MGARETMVRVMLDIASKTDEQAFMQWQLHLIRREGD